jgi:hypothetical protein
LASILVVLSVTSAIAVQAINKGNQISAQLLDQSDFQDTETKDLGDTTGLWVTGDSVILGIRSKLESREHVSLVNARVGRQAPELLAAIKVDQGAVPESPVIFNLGNNNALSKQTVIDIFEALKNQPKIVVVNTAVPRAWKETNNLIISKVAALYPGVKLIDWDRISKDRPDLFAPDGIHLSPLGSDVYVDLVLTALAK